MRAKTVNPMSPYDRGHAGEVPDVRRDDAVQHDQAPVRRFELLENTAVPIPIGTAAIADAESQIVPTSGDSNPAFCGSTDGEPPMKRRQRSPARIAEHRDPTAASPWRPRPVLSHRDR